MRPLVLIAPFLFAIVTSGCTAPGSYQQGYVQQGYSEPAQFDEPTFYDDRPAVIYGGQPSYIIEDPSLGWGWRGPDRHWHEAPRGWRGPGDWDRHRGGEFERRNEFRPQRDGYRQERPNYGRQQDQRQREAERPQSRPVEQQRPQPQQRPPQRQENQRRTCPAGQLIC